MTSLFERALSGVLTTCSVIMAGVLIHREFYTRPRPPILESARPGFVSNWKDVLGAAVTRDSATRPVVIAEFVDFECPVCAHFDSTMRAVVAARAGEVTWVLVHFPLPMHRMARQAANVVECGAERGKASEVARALFHKQDSLGLKEWTEYADEAGVSDTAWFRDCAARRTVPKRVDDGFRFGRAIGVNATPTLLVNGWKLEGAYRSEQIVALVDAIVGGRIQQTTRPEVVSAVLESAGPVQMR